MPDRRVAQREDVVGHVAYGEYPFYTGQAASEIAMTALRIRMAPIVAASERVYRAVLALPHPLGPELAEAIEELYRAIGMERPE